MQADREVGPHALEHVVVEPASAKVVFAVDLDPPGRRPSVEKFAVVPGAKADARAPALVRVQPFFSMASLPALPWTRLPPICTQVPAFTTLKSFGS